MRHHWDGGWGTGGWLLMGFGMLLFWTLVVVAIVWVVRTTGGRATHAGGPPPPHASPPRSTALDILDERYARGEIGDDEYRARRDALLSR